ncbi:MAG: NAD(P)H-hydrate dehydratase [Bacteroidales bacterium]|nr:NAD(P)H-hydrate dehydratase [Bacteroidales bacterium]
MTPHILSVPQIRTSEQFTMRNIPSLDLMENAGKACAEEITQVAFSKNIYEYVIFCGSGNNGGDGLVIARHVAEECCIGQNSVTVVICENDPTHRSLEFQKNFERWTDITNSSEFQHTVFFDSQKPYLIPEHCIVVDALFGIGLNKQVTGLHAAAIQCINASDAYVISVDIPSGLFADQRTPREYDVVMADLTLSVQFQKAVFMLPEAAPYYGEVRVVDINMQTPEDFVPERELLIRKNVRPLLKQGNDYAHKGTFGHGLLIAGSDAMPGAAILAATAAMRGGIGKLTVHTSGRALQTLPVALPEAILNPDDNDKHFSNIDWGTLQSSINAIAMGPGLGTDRQTVNAIKDVLDAVQAPIILDADALNMLADNKTWLAFLPQNSILTPHFREFEKLAGPATDDFDRIDKAKEFAKRYSVILILKGHHTVISMPDGKQFFNSTGNKGMATAGSGDTLTGLLLALLAQGHNPMETALLSVYLHGLAGDLYTAGNAYQSLIASDLPKYFSKAFQELTHIDEPFINPFESDSYE